VALFVTVPSTVLPSVSVFVRVLVPAGTVLGAHEFDCCRSGASLFFCNPTPAVTLFFSFGSPAVLLALFNGQLL